MGRVALRLLALRTLVLQLLEFQHELLLQVSAIGRTAVPSWRRRGDRGKATRWFESRRGFSTNRSVAEQCRRVVVALGWSEIILCWMMLRWCCEALESEFYRQEARSQYWRDTWSCDGKVNFENLGTLKNWKCKLVEQKTSRSQQQEQWWAR